ncbi:MAG: hypothetical protein PHW36_00640 [Bacilli bacterium]|nr:hypothetical protein [Bacilli bacterium]
MTKEKERLEKLIGVRVTETMYNVISDMADKKDRDVAEMARELMKIGLLQQGGIAA